MAGSSFPANDPNQPRVRVPLCGLNQLGNYFRSCGLPPETCVNGIEYVISGPPAGISFPSTIFNPSPNVPITSDILYTVINPGPLNSVFIRVQVLGGKSTRTLYQYMQHYAEQKPILKSVKVQYFSAIKGFAEMPNNIGKIYWSKQTTKGDNQSFTATTLNMADYWKPTQSNLGFVSPAAYLAAVKAGIVNNNIGQIEIHIPMNLQFDADTYFGIDSGAFVSSQVQMLATLYF